MDVGARYPDFMDALMPLASLPTQISGRNRAWRRVAIDAIRNDPEWKDGDYTTQPREPAHRRADAVAGRQQSDPAARRAAPTLADADRVLDEYVANYMKTGDANDILYAIEASRDYDPGPGLEKITRAARGDQLGRRHHQSARAADPRARDQARARTGAPSCCR